MMKILFCYLAYPFAIASYFRHEFENRSGLEVKTLGPYTGDWIPWNNGMNLPYKYVKPVDYALPLTMLSPSWNIVRNMFLKDEKFDAIVQIDAGWHFKDRPDAPCVVTVATDPHVLDYSVPRGYSDIFFNMQDFYKQEGDIYLPYAASSYYHFPEPHVPKIFDCSLIGIHYPQRDSLVAAIKSAGFTVDYNIGLIYDEYRHENNKATIGLNWSSLQDLPARVFESMAMGQVCITNRVPDLSKHFKEGSHYLGFDTIAEAVSQVKFVKDNPEIAKNIAHNGFMAVAHSHTYDIRVDTILGKVKEYLAAHV